METQLIPVVLLGCWDFCDDAHCFCCPEQLSICLECPSSSNSLCLRFLLANWSSRSTYSLKTLYFCLIYGRLSPFRKSFAFIIENGADLHYLERSQVLFLRESLHLHLRCWQSSCWQCHGDCIQIVAAEHISERWHHLLVLRSRRALEAGLVFSWEPVQRAELLAVISVSVSSTVSVNTLTCRPSRLWCWSLSCNSFQVVLVVLIFIVDTCENWSETNTQRHPHKIPA